MRSARRRSRRRWPAWWPGGCPAVARGSCRRVRLSRGNGVSRLGGSVRARRAGARLDGVGLLAAEEGGAVILVALGIAAGDGQRPRSALGQVVEEGEQVVGVLAGGI